MMKTLEADFARIPGLLGAEGTDKIGPAIEVAAGEPEASEAIPAGVGVPSHDLAVDPDEQLDLF
jgi:hypothetical protein